MAEVQRTTGDMFVAGNLAMRTLSIPSGTVDNDDIEAATGISASKSEHQYLKHYSQESDTKSVAEEYTIHCVAGATGDVMGFEAGLATTPAGTSTVTADLIRYRAGTTNSLLSAVITLDSDNSTAFVPEAATIATQGCLVDADVLNVVIACTDDGTNVVGKGVFVSCKIREDAD